MYAERERESGTRRCVSVVVVSTGVWFSRYCSLVALDVGLTVATHSLPLPLLSSQLSFSLSRERDNSLSLSLSLGLRCVGDGAAVPVFRARSPPPYVHERTRDDVRPERRGTGNPYAAVAALE